mgnify:CR=1 FL=1
MASLSAERMLTAVLVCSALLAIAAALDADQYKEGKLELNLLYHKERRCVAIVSLLVALISLWSAAADFISIVYMYIYYHCTYYILTCPRVKVYWFCDKESVIGVQRHAMRNANDDFVIYFNADMVMNTVGTMNCSVCLLSERMTCFTTRGGIHAWTISVILRILTRYSHNKNEVVGVEDTIYLDR